MCSRPVSKDIFDLKELIGSVSSDDREPKSLGAFPKCCLQDGALQLRWISCESLRSPLGLLCCKDSKKTRKRDIKRGNKKHVICLDYNRV